MAWHGRFMVFAWCLLIPAGIVLARFFKVTPRQRWPETLDNKLWWHSHLGLQYLAVALTAVAAFLAWRNACGATPEARIHRLLGWTVTSLAALQVIEGWLRGTKGGPGVAGDHYSMTPRRVAFEMAHKSGGYLAWVVAAITSYVGLDLADAPRWMFVLITTSWIFWITLFCALQRQGLALDTYQSIWGPGVQHPGNRRKPIGCGIRRRQ
jgi:hypothetical protein